MNPEDDLPGIQQRIREAADTFVSIAQRQIGKMEFEKPRPLPGGWTRNGEYQQSVQQIFVTVVVMDNSKTTYGTHIEGSVQIQGAVTNAFNTVNNFAESRKNPELAAQLDETVKRVKELVLPRLPEKKAIEVAEDLDAFTKEATRPEPRKKWYELSADGLLEAAKTVGEMAGPVTTAVKAVLALLSP